MSSQNCPGVKSLKIFKINSNLDIGFKSKPLGFKYTLESDAKTMVKYMILDDPMPKIQGIPNDFAAPLEKHGQISGSRSSL